MSEAERCMDRHGSVFCQGDKGHAGPHWADVGRKDALLRWGDPRSYLGCFELRCVRKPGHETPHNDGHGTSWWEDDEIEVSP